MTKQNFKNKIYAYYQSHRRTFPWRDTTDAYQILVSEFMLQQTQASRVVPKYLDFINSYPTCQRLSQAKFQQVLRLWQGLGYNRRAKFLYQTAQQIMVQYQGVIPEQVKLLEKLPGIGPYTARAITTFAYNQPQVFIETNIRTVYLHVFFNNQTQISDNQIRELVADTLDKQNPRKWYYALMDYGVYLKTTLGNPNIRSKHYSKQSPFIGSNRQIRGKILKMLLTKKKVPAADLYAQLQIATATLDVLLVDLEKEELIIRDKLGNYAIAA